MIDESSTDVYRRAKHLTMREARGAIKRGVLGGASRLSQTLRCGQVVVPMAVSISMDGTCASGCWDEQPACDCMDSEW